MSYNQKIIAIIAVLLIGITSAITFVLIKPPYCENFWLAYASLIVAECIFGGFWIQQIAKLDSVLPVSLGVWGINLVYLLIALVATMFTGMPEDKYRLLHVVVFSLFVIVHLLFRLFEHHVEKLGENESPESPINKTKITWR